jgi:glycosyltransferase involved in cell wall biosynthesis
LFEGLGNVLIESQAAGLPVVASADAIPKDTKITEIIEYVYLNDDISIWVDKCLKYLNFKRTDLSDIVKNKNYDAKTQAKRLQKKYEKIVLE